MLIAGGGPVARGDSPQFTVELAGGSLAAKNLAFDIKAPRTDSEKNIAHIVEVCTQNLLMLWKKAQEVDRKKVAAFRAAGEYTALSGYLTRVLYGK